MFSVVIEFLLEEAAKTCPDAVPGPSALVRAAEKFSAPCYLVLVYESVC